jgi:type IV pilus modification protein PilV
MSSRLRRPSLSAQSGFTIIEVMVAAMLLLVGMLGVVAMVDRASQSTNQTKMREGATSLARELVEQARNVPFDQLNTAALNTRLQALPGLAGVSQSPWVIERRGIRYTVTTEVCAVDDPADGQGSHAGGGFCSGQTPGTADAAPNDFKQVIARATYQEGQAQKTVRQTVLIATKGMADAPAVTALRSTNNPAGTPTEPMVTSSSTTSISFEATATSNADKVIWTLDGVDGAGAGTGQATLSGGKWLFTVNITSRMLDGTYEVGARAVSSSGREGVAFTIPMRLIRFVAAAPAPVTIGANTVLDGGTSKSAVELEWVENAARNVVGYRVYRTGETTPICPDATMTTLSTRTSCIDFAPTARTYNVHALYLDKDNVVQQSPATAVGPAPTSSPLNVYLGNTAVSSTSRCSGGTERNLLTAPVSGTSAGIGSTQLRWCSDGSAVSLSSATVTAQLTLANGHNAQDCTVKAAIGVNTAPATADSRTFPKKVTTTHTWTLTLPSSTILAGDRVNLVFDSTGAGCGSSGIVYASSMATGQTDIVKPNPPTGVTATAHTEGGVKLKWSPPSGGPTPAFYRVYRGGQAWTQRIDRTGDDTTLEIVDPDTTPGQNTQFYVSAVGEKGNLTSLAESTKVAVTG